MKSKTEQPEFSPISITFETQQEVIWLMGLLTCNAICNVMRKVDSDADKFFDDLHVALRPGDKNDLSYIFANKLDAQL